MEKTILIFTDGSCFPNPNGDMGIGVICYEALNFSISNKNTRMIQSNYDSINEIKRISKKIKFGSQGYGETSNNTAEHCAMMEAFVFIYSINEDANFIIFSDSDMAVKQMRGEYKMNPRLAYAYTAYQNKETLKELKDSGKNIEFVWIPRELNKKADELAKTT